MKTTILLLSLIISSSSIYANNLDHNFLGSSDGNDLNSGVVSGNSTDDDGIAYVGTIEDDAEPNHTRRSLVNDLTVNLKVNDSLDIPKYFSISGLRNISLDDARKENVDYLNEFRIHSENKFNYTDMIKVSSNHFTLNYSIGANLCKGKGLNCKKSWYKKIPDTGIELNIECVTGKDLTVNKKIVLSSEKPFLKGTMKLNFDDHLNKDEFVNVGDYWKFDHCSKRHSHYFKEHLYYARISCRVLTTSKEETLSYMENFYIDIDTKMNAMGHQSEIQIGNPHVTTFDFIDFDFDKTDDVSKMELDEYYNTISPHFIKESYTTWKTTWRFRHRKRNHYYNFRFGGQVEDFHEDEDRGLLPQFYLPYRTMKDRKEIILNTISKIKKRKTPTTSDNSNDDKNGN